MKKKHVAVVQDPDPGECPRCGSSMDDPLLDEVPTLDVKSQVCADEGCAQTVYCEAWCHTHFLARFSISTKRAKSEFAW